MPVHLESHSVIASGFLLLAASWKVLYDAQRHGSLAGTGPYAYVRYPQYVGFIPSIVAGTDEGRWHMGGVAVGAERPARKPAP